MEEREPLASKMFAGPRQGGNVDTRFTNRKDRALLRTVVNILLGGPDEFAASISLRSDHITRGKVLQVKNSKKGMIAAIAGLALALGTIAPASAVTINFPAGINCSIGKNPRTTSYAAYTVTHKLETGGGSTSQNFTGGAAYRTNIRTWTGFLTAYPNTNVSGVNLSSGSLICV